MNCACPVTLSPYSAPPCCRLGAEPTCPLERCEHIELGPIPASVETTSRALYDQYVATVSMLRDAQEQHRWAETAVRETQELLQETGDACLTLAAEESRLIDALRAAVAGEVGLRVGGVEQTGETLTEALARGPRYVGDTSVEHSG